MPSDFYITGGTLPADALCYVERQADLDLLESLLDAQFCYVLDTRQVGKSSLIERTARKLRERGTMVAKIDLTTTGKEVTPAQWYNGMLRQVADSLHAAGLPDCWDDLRGFWRDNGELGPMQRWVEALRSVVLANSDVNLVIFVDEIESVRSFDFTDEFFAGIRACYNRRVDEPALRRLSFCLAGSATPDELIRNVTSTPFNIGRGITLADFTPQEAAILAVGLPDKTLLARILYWTNGHPYLTQRLCMEITESASDTLTPSSISSDTRHPIPDTRIVDALCERLFFAPEARKSEKNLAFVAKRILDSPLDRASLLDLYGKVRRGGVVNDEKDALKNTLRLSGVARARNGQLEVRNRIYERVFDQIWIRENMPDAEVRRQRVTAWRVGLSIGSVAMTFIALMSWLTFRAVHAESLANTNAILAHQKTLEATKNAEKARRSAEEARRNATEAKRLANERSIALTHAQAEKMRADKNAEDAKRKAQEATLQTMRANNATAQARVAVQFKTAALKQTERFRYDGDIYLAQREIEAGNFIHAEQLLEATRHSPERSFEWFYLNDLCHTELRRFAVTPSTLSQTQPQKRLSMSPDGKQCLLIGKDRTLLVDTKTGGIVRKIGPDGAYYVSFLPDGKRALIAMRRKAPSPSRANQSKTASQTLVALWDTTTGKTLRHFPDAENFDNITISSDGSVVAAIRDTKESGTAMSVARVWEVATGKELTTIRVKKQSHSYSKGISAFALAPNGHRIAISQEIDTDNPDGSYNPSSKITYWNVLTSQKLWEVEQKYNEENILFSSDGRTILLSQNSIALLDTATGAPLPNWPQIGRAATFSHHGDMIAALDKGKILLYDLKTGKTRKELPFPEAGARPTFSPDDSQLVVGGVGGQIFVFEIATGRERLRLHGHSSAVEEIAITCDNRRITSVAETARLWYATRPRMGHIYQTASPRESAKLLPFPLTRPYDLTDVSYISGYLIAGNNAESLRSLERNLAVSPNNCWVASAEFMDNRHKLGYALHLRSHKGGGQASHDRILTKSWSEPNTLMQCSFTSDSQIVMATTVYKQLHRWYVATGKPVAPPLHDVEAISPDGHFAVVWRKAGKPFGKHSPKANQPEMRRYEMRELPTGHVWPLAALKEGDGGITLSQNGKLLAYSKDRTVNVLDGHTGRLVSRLIGHTSYVNHINFSPDGRRVATTSEDNTLRLWDTESGRIILVLPSDSNINEAPVFSPDGHDLVGVGLTGKLILLQKSPEPLMEFEDLSSADDILKAMAEAGDPAEMLVTAQRLLARDPTIKQTVALQLNAVAWNVVNPDAKAKPSPERITAAIQAAEQAVMLTNRQNADILDTLAAAYFANGSAGHSVELEMEALKLPDIAPASRTALMKNLALFKSVTPPH